MMELDEENEADSRLEDDLLMVVGIDDNGRVSQEDSYTAVMIEEVGGLEIVDTPLLGAKAERFGEGKMHTPLLGPDVKYVQLADSHTQTHPRDDMHTNVFLTVQVYGQL